MNFKKHMSKLDFFLWLTINWKLGPVTKIEKRSMASFKKIDDDVMSINCGTIVIVFVYGQFRTIQKLGSGHMVCNTYIFIKSFKFLA